jgi:hypothetical protein
LDHQIKPGQTWTPTDLGTNLDTHRFGAIRETIRDTHSLN